VIPTTIDATTKGTINILRALRKSVPSQLKRVISTPKRLTPTKAKRMPKTMPIRIRLLVLAFKADLLSLRSKS
jgi:hypothetical protein